MNSASDSRRIYNSQLKDYQIQAAMQEESDQVLLPSMCQVDTSSHPPNLCSTLGRET